MGVSSGPESHWVLPEPIPLSEMTTGQDVSAAERAELLAAATALSAPGAPVGPDGA